MHLNADRLFATSGPPDIMRWRSPPTGLSAPDGTVFEPHLNPLSGWMGSNPEFSRPRSFRNRLEISLGQLSSADRPSRQCRVVPP